MRRNRTTLKPIGRACGVALALAVALAACGNPGGPSGGGGGGGGGSTPPAITCPANITVDSASSGVPVTYPPPTTSGGTAPLTTTCDIPSGTALALGTHTVTCTTRDAASQSASCTFTITVQAIPMLRGSQLLAYGDSITAGETAPDQKPSVIDVANAYPAILQSMLRARYKAQTITVLVVGTSRQTAEEGRQALPSTLAQTHPDALLLLEGANDINQGQLPSRVAAILGDDVRIAQTAGVQMVFLSTLLPKTLCPPNATTPCNSDAETQQATVDTNVLIRNVAATTGAVLVDNYNALIPAPTMYIGDDGLHPTKAGHQKIAETFFDAIRNNFEAPPPAVMPRTIRR